MANLSERINRIQQKMAPPQGGPSPAQEQESQPYNPEQAIQPSVNSVAVTPNIVQERQTANALPDNLPTQSGARWQEMAAKDAYSYNPKLTPSEYISGVAKYRSENGAGGLTYEEIANALRGRDPYESEADRVKQEKRLRAAEKINAIGSVLANVVNVVRTQNGHAAMDLSDIDRAGSERINKLREYAYRLGRQNNTDYIGAMARDRAERARQAALEAQQGRWKAQQESDNEKYKFGVYKFNTEQASKQAEAERKAEHASKQLEETNRHNKTMEGIGWTRANNSGNGSRKEQFIDVPTKGGNGSRRYSPKEHGNNWITSAYKDVIDQTGGDGSPYKVNKDTGPFGGSATPSNQEMYESISRYSSDQWKNKYKRDKGDGNNEKPPLN